MQLNNAVEIVVATNSFRALRGRAYSMAILDEVCLWRDESSANPDVDTYESIDPGFASLGGMCIGISTPFQRSDLAYSKWERHFGKDDDDVLVVGGPSIVFNPSIPQRVIDTAMARDSTRARAEWLGDWRDAESAFLSLDLIKSAVDEGVVVRPPESHHYLGFCDAAGGAGSD